MMTTYQDFLRKTLLRVLLWLGLAGGGVVGIWVGTTYIFDGDGKDPVILEQRLLVPSHGLKGVALLEVDCDKLCRIFVTTENQTGVVTEYTREVIANKWTLLLEDPDSKYRFYKLAPGFRPDWMKSLTVTVSPILLED